MTAAYVRRIERAFLQGMKPPNRRVEWSHGPVAVSETNRRTVKRLFVPARFVRQTIKIPLAPAALTSRCNDEPKEEELLI